MSDKNTLVIVTIVGGSVLKNCISENISADTQCIVITSNEEDMGLQKDFPGLSFINGSSLPVPAKRLEGARACQTEYVTFLEDTCMMMNPLWEVSAISVFENNINTAAMSGPIEIGDDLAGQYKALACTEYGRYHPAFYKDLEIDSSDVSYSNVSRLPGSFMMYRLDALKEVIDHDEGLIEVLVNNKLREQGGVLIMHTDLSTRYSGEDVHGARLSARRQHGRLYAGKISSGDSFPARVIMFSKAFLLPMVLSLRGIHYARRILKASDLPSVVIWIICMETFWSMGEAWGYLFGAGKSIEAWG